MRDTGCHIHFPDSNKASKELKSNQVTIAGNTLTDLEKARGRIRVSESTNFSKSELLALGPTPSSESRLL
jgi:hypothetical protein